MTPPTVKSALATPVDRELAERSLIPSKESFELLREDASQALYRTSSKEHGALLFLSASGDAGSAAARYLDSEMERQESLCTQWAVVPRALVVDDHGSGLWLSDPGGELLLRQIGQPWGTQAFLRAALAIVRSVGLMHDKGMVHRDLKPGNIFLDPDARAAWLMGFAMASHLPRERRTLGRPERLAGTLPYMSPEQTGRMNRSMDSRSDLYTLGVIFYEMLSGGLPFHAGDPLEWIHCHVARQPRPLSERQADVPEQLSAIVMKLLAKAAEERYQTAAGLALDLERCLAEWNSNGSISAFRLSTQDQAGRLLMPERVYGRDREIEALLAAFGRVLADGHCEVTLVSGYSGIGKSSIVNELHKLIVMPRGIFISGKFDQTLRDTPYSTIGNAFRDLVGQICEGDSEEAAFWRKLLQRELDGLGALLVEVVPELVALLGPQAPLPSVAASEASQRFNAAFQRLIGVFARKEHPLVLFVDDLQWMDPATLSLLQYLATSPETRYLHIVGAFRDNEVGPGHPLLETIAAIGKSGVHVGQLTLGALKVDDVCQLLCDALRLDASATRELAAAIHLRTAGNPFFVGQFLVALEEEGALRFDPESRQWIWDIRDIGRMGSAHNLANLMIGRLRRLPERTREGLKLLACFGSQTDFSALSLVDGNDRTMHGHMRPAVDAGILLVDDDRYRFLHDRVQEAAYALIDTQYRSAWHLRIGQALAAGLPPDKLAERIFDVANQMNAGEDALATLDDRVLAASINLQAARKAKISTAFDAACNYLHAGARALGPEAWQRQGDLAFALCFERADCEISRARLDDAEEYVKQLLEHGRSAIDLARAQFLRMTLQLIRGEMTMVQQSAYEGLQMLGHAFPRHPTHEDVQAGYDAVRAALGDQPIESLIELSPGEDPQVNATLGILYQLGLAAYFTDVNLCQTIAYRIVLLTLEHGLYETSTFGFAVVGITLGPFFNQFADGERFARAAEAITKKYRYVANNAAACLTLQQAILWTRPVDEALACLDMSYRLARTAGSPIFASYAVEHRLTDLMFRGDSLDSLRAEIKSGLEFAEQNQVRHVGDIIASMAGFVAALRSPSEELLLQSEQAIEERALSSGIPVVACFHWILQVQRQVVLGAPLRALEYARLVEPLLWSARCHIQSANFCFHESLALAAACADADDATRTDHCLRLQANLALLQQWVRSCPSSFVHRHALVAAEVATLEGRTVEAMRLYEQSIRRATEKGFTPDLALACERGAAHAASLGMELMASAYLRQAREAYLQWGAHLKVALIDRQQPALPARPLPVPSPMIEASLAEVDLATIVKVAQMLSGEIVLERLVDKLLTISIEHAGAQRGTLILRAQDQWLIEAVALSNATGVTVDQLRRPVESDDLPLSLLDKISLTQQGVLINDARAMPEYSADAYVQRHRPRSILCLPLVRRGELIGALYLENNLASSVFTAGRQAVLDLVSSQAAISLQNAELFGRVERENAERRQSELALRQSEERYALAMEAAADGHVDWIAESDVFYASPRFLEQWGLAPEVSATSSREIIASFPFHPDDRAGVIAQLAASLVGDAKRVQFDTRVIRAGEVRWMRATTLYLRDAKGKLLRTSTATTDITDRKRVEEELRASEERHALAVAGSNESIFDLDLDSGQLYLTHRTQELLGIAPGDMVRDVESWNALVRLHRDDVPRHKAALDAHLAGLTQMYDIEVRYILPHGVRWLRQRGQALRDERGKAYRFLGSVGDVTDRKREQEELLRLEARLRQAERFEAMGTLAGGIAHDFNNILGAILGFGERARLAAKGNSRQHRDLTNVIVAGERGRELIERILSFSYGTASEGSIVHAEKLVREALDLLQAMLPERLRLEVRLDAGSAGVRSDAAQIHQLVMNLGTNAIRAMTGSGTLSVSLGLQHIAQHRVATVGVVTPGKWLSLRVADEGRGIPAEVLPRIFDPFFTTKEAGVGTGLGLSLVLRIVTQADGAIDVESRPGAGSVFTVYLPHAGEAPEPPSEEESPAPRGQGQRILVVDDDAALLELTVDTLRKLGYEALGVRTGRAALAKLRKTPQVFEMLITDQRMPSMSGEALIREVRLLDPLLPVILVSGYLGDTAATLKHDGQADEVLAKPLRTNELANCIARLLGSS